MYIADLHVHSRYSRATSRDCTPEFLDLWARRKGICLIGTGDFTHPAWRQELCEKLRPAEEGLYVLKEEYRMEDGLFDDSIVPRFVVTGEISSIYKKSGKNKKSAQPSGAARFNGSRKSVKEAGRSGRKSSFRRATHSGNGL